MINFSKKSIILFLVIFITIFSCSCMNLTRKQQSPYSSSDNFDSDNNNFSLYDIQTEHHTGSETNDIPDFSNLDDLRDYINNNHENGILNMKFSYSGEEELTSDILLKLITILQVSYTYDGFVYDLTLSDYIGNKIISAYNSGDYSWLSKDEISAMKMAEEIVNKAKVSTSSSFELELYLHDYLAALVDYSYEGANIPDPDNPPRHLTVVGALLDGSANCQGYADAFYVLGKMAGFDVSRLSLTSEGVGHMVNLIKIGEQWYVVDVTFNDSNDTAMPETCSYMSFNIGRDFCTNYEWNEISEYHKIADKTDHNFYYFSDEKCIDFGYEKVFYNMEDLADELATEWDKRGTSDFHVALMNENDISKLSDIIYKRLSKLDKSFSYSFTQADNTRDCFLHFTIE